jgi:hypothetical protein
MAFTLISSTPGNQELAVPIDTKIELVFSKPVDFFTIQPGISLYSIGSQTWTGSMLSSKDSLTSDVKSSADQINLVEYSFAVSGSTITLTPNAQLNKNTKYYLQIAPGSDLSRFLSASTCSQPIYSYATSGNNGQVEILSSYNGSSNAVYQLLFNGSDSFDLMIDGMYSDSYSFVQHNELRLNKHISISLNGLFGVGDVVELQLIAPESISGLVKYSFTTSEYTEEAPRSTRIEDKLYATLLNELKIVSTIPASLSVNNSRVNPIIIKFNKPIDTIQDLLTKINIVKLNLETGSTKRIKYYPQILNDTLKLYLVQIDSMSTVSELPVFKVVEDAFSVNSSGYNLIAERIFT